MKKNIHPKCDVVNSRCVCGKVYPVLSTKETVVVSFCSACHPFYTNKQQFADFEGRIEKYNKKFGLKNK